MSGFGAVLYSSLVAVVLVPGVRNQDGLALLGIAIATKVKNMVIVNCIAQSNLLSGNLFRLVVAYLRPCGILQFLVSADCTSSSSLKRPAPRDGDRGGKDKLQRESSETRAGR